MEKNMQNNRKVGSYRGLKRYLNVCHMYIYVYLYVYILGDPCSEVRCTCNLPST